MRTLIMLVFAGLATVGLAEDRVHVGDYESGVIPVAPTTYRMVAVLIHSAMSESELATAAEDALYSEEVQDRTHRVMGANGDYIELEVAPTDTVLIAIKETGADKPFAWMAGTGMGYYTASDMSGYGELTNEWRRRCYSNPHFPNQGKFCLQLGGYRGNIEFLFNIE